MCPLILKTTSGSDGLPPESRLAGPESAGAPPVPAVWCFVGAGLLDSEPHAPRSSDSPAAATRDCLSNLASGAIAAPLRARAIGYRRGRVHAGFGYLPRSPTAPWSLVRWRALDWVAPTTECGRSPRR